jgi:hypothetical protein
LYTSRPDQKNGLNRLNRLDVEGARHVNRTGRLQSATSHVFSHAQTFKRLKRFKPSF